jgi:hypothetical protein
VTYEDFVRDAGKIIRDFTRHLKERIDVLEKERARLYNDKERMWDWKARSLYKFRIIKAAKKHVTTLIKQGNGSLHDLLEILEGKSREE